jgi:endonuclease YncB( thermonuclease family)
MFLLRSARFCRFGVLALGLAVAPQAQADSLPGPIPAVVERVIDGDTLEVRARIWLDQVVTTSVRLAGVNTAEVRRAPCNAHLAAGQAAKAFVEALGLADVTLLEIEHDKYGGRVVARLILPDGRDLSELLLAEGHAIPIGAPDPWCAASSPVAGTPAPAGAGGD